MNTRGSRSGAWNIFGAIAAFFAIAALTAMSATGCLGEPVDAERLDDEEGEIGEAAEAVTYNGHDYLFVMNPLDWPTAKTYCQLAGYQLVSINSSAEESFLAAQEEHIQGDPWWIGYSDAGIEGFWIWEDGSLSSYSNWAPNEPNNWNNQDCATDRYNSMGQWDDDTCSKKWRFICEKPSLASPATGTFSYSATNTNNATTGTTNQTVTVYANQMLTVGTCGLPGASVTSGDTWIRLFQVTSTGQTELFSLDDGCGNATNFSYIVPATGQYIIKAGCYLNQSCSGTVAWKIQVP